MKDEKILHDKISKEKILNNENSKEEILEDEQLDKVSGGVSVENGNKRKPDCQFWTLLEFSLLS